MWICDNCGQWIICILECQGLILNLKCKWYKTVRHHSSVCGCGAICKLVGARNKRNFRKKIQEISFRSLLQILKVNFLKNLQYMVAIYQNSSDWTFESHLSDWKTKTENCPFLLQTYQEFWMSGWWQRCCQCQSRAIWRGWRCALLSRRGQVRSRCRSPVSCP